ncbi:hypothetical protein PG994_014264 [Apiospora phragmitis]|uniref:Uncharacterized protein n=1 Tax=Apiospora phragmitis TaxID=2905665 RepID=A0ABR1T495_9PEZI
MCKQYVYLSICLEHDCDSIVRKKGRNTYCRAVRHGTRRLASCVGGLEYVITSRHRGTLVCDECKQLRVLRTLYLSALALTAAAEKDKGKKGGSVPTAGRGDEGLLSDDGSSYWETVEDDEESTGSLHFFANEKEKAEKLAAAYDFDLALRQEIAALDDDEEDLHAESQGEEEDYLSVEDPESARHNGRTPPLPDYYGFDAVDVKEEKICPRPQPQYAAAQEKYCQGTKRQLKNDDVYDSDTTGPVVMTPSESEYEGEVEINNDLHFEPRHDFLHRNCVVRVDGARCPGHGHESEAGCFAGS